MPSIIHYRDKCIGCNICYEAWPVRWRMSKIDGKATMVGGVKKKQVYVANISSAELDINKRIADMCPVKVIKVS